MKKGFTLIELLVVIAIIGILSSIVLVSLNQARQRGRDASAQASLSSIRAEAEIYFNNEFGTYDGVCESDDSSGNIVGLLNAAGSQVGGTALCFDGPTAWAASITLLNGNFYCVDSTGFAGRSDAVLGNNTTVCTPYSD